MPRPSTVSRPRNGERSGDYPGATQILGGAFDPPHRDVAPEGGVLIGFEVGLGKFIRHDIIRLIRPIYRTPKGEVLGTQFGTDRSRVLTVKAREGYAVTGMTAKHGLNFDGFSLTFARVGLNGIDPKDSYESDWIGILEEKQPTRLAGNGVPAIGIVAKTNKKNELTGLGLQFQLTAEDMEPEQPRLFGFTGGKEFRDEAPEGGMLVGLEVGVGTPYGHDSIVALRGIYRTAKGDILGQQHGQPVERTTTLKAKDGFAIGALQIKSGGAVEGLSVTFLRVTPAGLDPGDSYESEWLGREGRGGRRVGGTGQPIQGLVGRVREKENDLAVLGLLFRRPVEKPKAASAPSP